MFEADPEAARNLLEAAIAAFAVLGGCMAYVSGYYASLALAQGESSDTLAQRINEGIAVGFRTGAQLSVVALMIALWSGSTV